VRTPYTPEELAVLQRRRDRGESVREIADDLGVSRQWVHELLRRPNPLGVETEFRCRHCGDRFRSTARSGPERCPACRRYGWRP